MNTVVHSALRTLRLSRVRKLRRDLHLTGKAARKMAKRMRRENPATLNFITS